MNLAISRLPVLSKENTIHDTREHSRHQDALQDKEDGKDSDYVPDDYNDEDDDDDDFADDGDEEPYADFDIGQGEAAAEEAIAAWAA